MIKKYILPYLIIPLFVVLGVVQWANARTTNYYPDNLLYPKTFSGTTYLVPVDNSWGVSTTIANFNTLTANTATFVDSTNASGTVSIYATSTDTTLTVRQASSGDIINLFDGTTEVFTVLDGGKVGIGTTTPTALLSVNAPAGIDPFQIGSSTATYFKVDKTGDTAAFSAGHSLGFLNTSANFVSIFYASNSNRVFANISKNSAQNGDLLLGNLIMDSSLASGSTTIMWLGVESDPAFVIQPTSNGAGSYSSYKVGIGTSTPLAFLTVAPINTTTVGLKVRGYTGQTTDLFQVASSTNSILFNVAKDGKVGIGTSSPDSLLTIHSTATTTVNIDTSSITQGSCIEMKNTANVIYHLFIDSGGTLQTGAGGC